MESIMLLLSGGCCCITWESFRLCSFSLLSSEIYYIIDWFGSLIYLYYCYCCNKRRISIICSKLDRLFSLLWAGIIEELALFWDEHGSSCDFFFSFSRSTFSSSEHSARLSSLSSRINYSGYSLSSNSLTATNKGSVTVICYLLNAFNSS